MLQGDLRINRTVVGSWFATRRSQNADIVPNLYECGYWHYGRGGRLPSSDTMFTFNVDHTPADGAVVLAAKILAAAVEATR